MCLTLTPTCVNTVFSVLSRVWEKLVHCKEGKSYLHTQLSNAPTPANFSTITIKKNSAGKPELDPLQSDLMSPAQRLMTEDQRGSGCHGDIIIPLWNNTSIPGWNRRDGFSSYLCIVGSNPLTIHPITMPSMQWKSTIIG